MAFSKKEGAESLAIAKPKTKTNNWEPSSLRWILSARKSRRRPQFRPHHLRIRARRRLRRRRRRPRLFRQRLTFHQQLHFVGVEAFPVQQSCPKPLQRFSVFPHQFRVLV